MGCIENQLPDVSPKLFYYIHSKKIFYLSGEIK